MHRIEPDGVAQVGPNALQALPLDDRADVIEHQAAHRSGERQIGRARQAHADQTALAGTDQAVFVAEIIDMVPATGQR